jgi:hypothetical protein
MNLSSLRITIPRTGYKPTEYIIAEPTITDDSFIGSVQSDYSIPIGTDNFKEMAIKWRYGINLDTTIVYKIFEFLDTKLF